MILKVHVVPEETEAIRLYDYAQEIFTTIPSRKGIKKAIARQEIIVDGKKASTGLWVKPGQKIELLESRVNPPKVYALKLEVVYEDEYLAVINKPAGIPVSGNQFRTIQNALLGNIRLSKEEDALRWPKPVHRLDAATSGLLMIAKTATALMKLGQLLEYKKIKKEYQAIVIGQPNAEGSIDFKIETTDAVTKYERILFVPSLRNKYLSLLKLFPETGRTHQLRIHLSRLGYPILGDKLYGESGEILRGKGLFLCAVGLNFVHPITNIGMVFRVDLPPKFFAILKRENRRWEKYQ